MKKVLLTLACVLALGSTRVFAEDARCPIMRSTLQRLQADQRTHISMSGSPDANLEMVIIDLQNRIAELCEVVPPTSTCAEMGMTGIYPNCVPVVEPPVECPEGTTGISPNCVPVVNPPTSCPEGTTGTPPNCVPVVNPPTSCPEGTTGTPPNCVPVVNPPTTCPSGTTGTPPNCVPIVNPEDPDDTACMDKLNQIKAQVDIYQAQHKSRSFIVRYVNEQQKILRSMGCDVNGHTCRPKPHNGCNRHDHNRCQHSCKKSGHGNCGHR